MKGRLSILFAMLSTLSWAQDIQTSLNTIQYQSEFERKQFERFFIHHETNYLELFVASDRDGNAALYSQLQMKLDKILNDNYSAKLNKKSASKKVKSIYETIHKELLEKYTAENLFTNVIENGSYNCVTATALYALAFEKLNIPYVIQERPTHVYALAYPNEEQIAVESTDPIGGFLSFNERYKSAFVKQMTKAKLIGTKESKTKSLQTLFNEYYFKDTQVDMVKLIGIQYMNQGIYALNNNQTKKAIDNFEKAHLFYPSEKIGYVLLVTRLQYLSKSRFTAPYDSRTLAKLEEHRSLGLTVDAILNEFQRGMNELLIENSDVKSTEAFYHNVLINISNDTLSTEISHHYYFERARILYNQGDYSKSLNYSSQAIKLKPWNQNTESLFVNALANKVRSNSDFKTIQNELESYAQAHEQLNDNKLFTSMLANTYLVLFAQSYDFKRIKEGEEYHELFKNTYEQGMNIDQNNVGRAYSIAAVHYFRLGNKNKAKAFLSEGLAIAPGNYELQTRLRMIR